MVIEREIMTVWILLSKIPRLRLEKLSLCCLFDWTENMHTQVFEIIEISNAAWAVRSSGWGYPIAAESFSCRATNSHSVPFICVGMNIAKPVPNNSPKFPFFWDKLSLDGLRDGPRYLRVGEGLAWVSNCTCVPCPDKSGFQEELKHILGARRVTE